VKKRKLKTNLIVLIIFSSKNQTHNEKHEKFSAVPTFALALTFWAGKKNSGTNNFQSIPPFPPPLMASEEVLPIRFLRRNGKGNVIDILNLPVIHTWQSIVWHQSLKIPTGIKKR